MTSVFSFVSLLHPPRPFPSSSFLSPMFFFKFLSLVPIRFWMWATHSIFSTGMSEPQGWASCTVLNDLESPSPTNLVNLRLYLVFRWTKYVSHSIFPHSAREAIMFLSTCIIMGSSPPPVLQTVFVSLVPILAEFADLWYKTHPQNFTHFTPITLVAPTLEECPLVNHEPSQLTSIFQKLCSGAACSYSPLAAFDMLSSITLLVAFSRVLFMNWWETLQAGGKRLWSRRKCEDLHGHSQCTTLLVLLCSLLYLLLDCLHPDLFFDRWKKNAPLYTFHLHNEMLVHLINPSAPSQSSAQYYGKHHSKAVRKCFVKNIYISDSVTNQVFFHLKYCVRIITIFTTKLITFTLRVF